LVFITIFSVVGYGSQRIGVGYTAMLTKLSVVFPTLLSFLLFGDEMGPERWAGIGVALLAVVLLHLKYFAKHPSSAGSVLPSGVSAQTFIAVAIALFLGAGAVDSLLRLYSGWFATTVAFDTYLTVLFAAAALGGGAATALQVVRGRERLEWKNLAAGIALGVPNYFSILFITMGLAQLEGTVFFPLNNIGQLLVATVAGAVLYRETLPISAILGIFVAILAVLLIALKPLLLFLGL
jgi:drug/metabolite transporter (DMT)-like permease